MNAMITSRRVKRYYAEGRGFATERAAARFIAKKRIRAEVVSRLKLVLFDEESCRTFPQEGGPKEWIGGDRQKWGELYNQMVWDGHWEAYEDHSQNFRDCRGEPDDRAFAKAAYKNRLNAEIEKILAANREALTVSLAHREEEEE